MIQINLLIIGAGKPGMASLSRYLATHPDIIIPSNSEIHYFTFKELYQQGEEYLDSLFRGKANGKLTCIADNYLLIDRKAPKRVFKHNPEMKLIAVLEDPVKHAFSSYKKALKEGLQSSEESFLESLNYEEARCMEGDIVQKSKHCHFYGGLYYAHLRKWMEYFPKEQFLLLTSKELEDYPRKALEKISLFLNIDPFNAALNTSLSVSENSTIRNQAVNRIQRLVSKFIIRKFQSAYSEENKATIALTEEERKAAREFFKEDLKHLELEFKITFPENYK